jgi:hypothetical protein
MKNITSAIGRRARFAVRWYVESCSQLEPAAVLGMFGTGVGHVGTAEGFPAGSSDAQSVERTADAGHNEQSSRLRHAGAIAAGSVVIAGAALLANVSGAPGADLLAPATSAAQVQGGPAKQAGIGIPPRAFDQNMNASDGIRALESEGYNVEINWGGGRTDQQLSLCRISAVDGLRGSGAAASLSSVYVTVVC